MKTIKAEEINALTPGSKVRINNDVWIRMEDWPARNLDGLLVHAESGRWHSWYSLCLLDDDVELLHEGAKQD